MSTDFVTLRSLGIHVEQNSPLSKWTTFQLGGNCPTLLCCSTPEQLQAAVSYAIQNKIKFMLMGWGSNLVVSDQGLDCWVIRYVSEKPIIGLFGQDLTASGSTSLDALALYAAEHGLAGLNSLHGIPGTVGGAIVGNAGAFGKQVGDVLKSATLLSAQGTKRIAVNADLQFTYRNSKLKETGEIVMAATFALTRGDRATLLNDREEILKIRQEKHPDLQMFPCAGSFFRNIEPTSKAEKRQAAGWFLEQAGGKNLYSGGAKIFDKHANIIVKADLCTAKDVYDLSQKMMSLVHKAYGFELIREVRFVGKFPGVAESEKDLIW